MALVILGLNDGYLDVPFKMKPSAGEFPPEAFLGDRNVSGNG